MMDTDNTHISPDRVAEYELMVAVGDPPSLHGLTRVTIDGTGRFVAEHVIMEQGKQVTRESLRDEMSPERAQQLLAQATRFPWRSTFPNRPGLPDEATVTWTLRTSDERHVTCTAWLRDVEKDEAMAPVLNTLREKLAVVSKGKLYL